MRISSLLFLLLLIGQNAGAQHVKSNLYKSFEQRSSLRSQSLLNNYPTRNVGPVVQGGRIIDIEVSSTNDKVYYVAYASGGIFKSENRGITFSPVFDNQGALGVGDMALAPSDQQVIYVGTGENNSSRSSYAGTGVYKSVDAGQNWRHLGLTETHHIGKVVVHPQNADIVWVAALGALYSHNESRGVYKSVDGGNTWEKTLFINDSTGVIDLVINPSNPDQLWASAWERTRKAGNFKGSGDGSGIYRSDDGGATWQKMNNGFPQGQTIGRIGLNISASNSSVIYALLDNQQNIQKNNKKEKDEFTLGDFRDMTVEHLLELDDELLNTFLKDNDFPEKYTASSVKEDVRQGKYPPIQISEYFGDANEALFNTSVAGAELYKSADAGSSWEKVNSYALEGVYFTYGYYFGEVRVDPTNSDKVYVFGVPLLKSDDGGSTFTRIDTVGDVHVDHQALWIDPKDPAHLLLGNDGGLYESYDEGANWRHINNMSVGQFYTVNVDMERPYNIYGGLQDNGTLVGSSQSIPNITEHWERLFGGDGMFVAPDPMDNNVVYAGFQFGNYYRINRKEKQYKKISPRHDIGEDKLRYNWRTPLLISSHNGDILYIGAQKLYRSMDRGDHWEAISPDLTKNLPQGNVPVSTISSVVESPLSFGLLFVGTDDGKVHLSKAGEWKDISAGLPENKWVASLYASNHDPAEVYIALNGYREDDFSTYIYRSHDYGMTWHSIKGNLPEIVANDIQQDIVNPDLLYLATDHGTYISLNKGESWQVMGSIPNVASYAMIVHPRDGELVVATHGRSIYVTDVEPMRQIAGQTESAIKIFGPRTVAHSDDWGQAKYPYLKPALPKVSINYYVGQTSGPVKFEVKDENQEIVSHFTGAGTAGFHTTSWDLKRRLSKRKKPAEEQVFLEKGKYTIRAIAGGNEDTMEFEIK